MVFCIAVSAIWLIEVNAEEEEIVVKPRAQIGIMLDETCQGVMLVLTPNCGTHEELQHWEIIQHPERYGKIVNGHREVSPYGVLPERYFRSLPGVLVMVDPPQGMLKHADMIWISSKIAPVVHTEITDEGITVKWNEEYHMNSGCSNAIIHADFKEKWLAPIIYHMIYGCADMPEYYSHTERQYREKIPSLELSLEWQRQNHYKNLASNCIYTYGACSEVSAIP